MDDIRLIDANKLLSIFCTDCGMREESCSNSCEKDCDIYDTIMTCPTVEATPCTYGDTEKYDDTEWRIVIPNE